MRRPLKEEIESDPGLERLVGTGPLKQAFRAEGGGRMLSPCWAGP